MKNEDLFSKTILKVRTMLRDHAQLISAAMTLALAVTSERAISSQITSRWLPPIRIPAKGMKNLERDAATNDHSRVSDDWIPSGSLFQGLEVQVGSGEDSPGSFATRHSELGDSSSSGTFLSPPGKREALYWTPHNAY